MMKYLLVLVIVMVVSVKAEEMDHNKDTHKALCRVLREVVGAYQSGSGSEALKKALKKTIFGNETGGDLETLKGLPSDYDDVLQDVDSRSFACGQPRNHWEEYKSVYQPRWSGHSAPHDLVCLCTVGHKGWPLNGTTPEKEKEKLCGKSEAALGGNKEGWDSIEHDKGKDQIKATWENVTSECLQGVGKGETLKDALKGFTEKLVPQPIKGQESRKQLGEGKPDEIYACTGSKTYGVCVMYYPIFTAHTWWVDLQKAIQEDEKIQEQKKRDEEKEKRREQEDAENKNSAQEEALKSTSTTTNQTAAPNKDTLHEKLRKLNMTSGTPIIPPPSWLLRVALLI
ncbi:Variant surface glycoprotein [Trypanosoma congolense IL3000]|uniref:Variant surface glycoprotein n=1 Tax=Trypanosoma congolense (strain IL3000) TaxID=1068625 RepID=F9WGJ0_TRYCI|nr:Variant surface glycoprotein [Trypanosoma congolense IL3000]